MPMLPRHPPSLPFVLPFAVFLVAGLVESAFPFPLAYALRIGLTTAVLLAFLPIYLAWRPRVPLRSVLVGLIGVVLWISLARLGVERAVLGTLGVSETWVARGGYDPLSALGDHPLGLAAFLALRFFGLVCVVPVMEEFFLRGFFVRWVIDLDWWQVSVGSLTPTAVAAVIGYAVLSHPAEALAAAVWFSLITWLVWKSRNVWDAVVAHAVTNLLLGLYILAFREWSLW